MAVHPTAVIDPTATLADDVDVGPHACIGADVSLAAGCKVGAHAVLQGPMQAGINNHFHAHSMIGGGPQHLAHLNSKAPLIIGDTNIFREFVTVNRGTEATTHGSGKTVLGSNNYLMAYVHVGHDCNVGDHNTFVNHATLAGHVHIDDHVTLTGFVAVHQFVHVGSYAFLGRATKVGQSILPYSMVTGVPGKPVGLNLLGLRRAGFDRAAIKLIKEAYKTIFHSNLSLQQACLELSKQSAEPVVALLLDFIKKAERGLARPNSRVLAGEEKASIFEAG